MTPSLDSGNFSIACLPPVCSVTTAIVSMPEIMLLFHTMQQKMHVLIPWYVQCISSTNVLHGVGFLFNTK